MAALVALHGTRSCIRRADSYSGQTGHSWKLPVPNAMRGDQEGQSLRGSVGAILYRFSNIDTAAVRWNTPLVGWVDQDELKRSLLAVRGCRSEGLCHSLGGEQAESNGAIQFPWNYFRIA